MANSEDPTGRALALVNSATPARGRRRTASAAVARAAAEVAGLLPVEVLGNPQARGGRARPGTITGVRTLRVARKR